MYPWLSAKYCELVESSWIYTSDGEGCSVLIGVWPPLPLQVKDGVTLETLVTICSYYSSVSEYHLLPTNYGYWWDIGF